MLSLHDAWRTHLLSTIRTPSTCQVLGASYRQKLANDSRDPTPWVVDVRFIHEHGGERYEREDTAGEYANSAFAHAAAARYPAGAQVECLYRPGDPSVVAIRQRGPDEWITSAVLGGTVTAIPFVVLALPSTRRRRR